MEQDTARFIDLIIFYIGVAAYARIAEESDPHLTGGTAFGLRTLGELRTGYEDILKPYTESGHPAGKLSVKGPVNRIIKATSRNAKAVINVGAVSGKIMVKMGRKPQIRDDMFQDRALQSARRLISAVNSEDSPGPLLKKLAAITAVSSFKRGRRWIEKAAQLAGHPLSDVESIQMAAEEATGEASAVNQTVADIEGTDPMSPQGAALQDKKREGLDKIQRIADSSKSPDVVVGAAVDVLNSGKPAPVYKYKTDTGRSTGADPDQEIAMMVRGPSIIAAGAGSGKTRCLASKVVYHMKELGLSPTQIIACSFTKASAAELMSRINKYGGDIDFDSRAIKGFGTTHSISKKLLYQYGGGEASKKIFNGQYLLMELAKRQVQMKSKGAVLPVDESESFFETEKAHLDVGKKDRIADLDQALQKVYRYFWDQRENSSFWASEDQQVTISKWIDFLKGLKGIDPLDLTDKDRAELNRLLGHPTKKKPKGQYYWRKEQGLRGKYKVGADSLDPAEDSDDEGRSYQQDEAVAKLLARKEKKRKSIEDRLRKKYPTWYDKPANQWFNQGFSEDDMSRPHPYLKAGNKPVMEPIPNGDFMRYQTKIKGDARAPGEAWKMSREADEADQGTQDRWELMPAVYGAYEWLMKNEQEASTKTTFDEMLLNVAQLLVRDPAALQRVRKDFKMILVDEAQDLNRTSHIAFGLIAGYLDPETLEPYGKDADGKPIISADTYTLIGDGKQSIYGFRGSNVKLFESQSDTYQDPDGEENGGFTTRILNKNYRSGSDIVDAAQALSENMDTIKMVCYAWDQKGKGEIYEDVVKGLEPDGVPDYLARIIKDKISGDDPDFKIGDFGYAARTNKQATAMAMACLRKSIPFKTKKSIFGKNSQIANVIKLIVFAKKGADNIKLSNATVLECTNTPVFILSGDTLKTKFNDLGVTNYFKFLSEGGWRQLYSGSWADNLRQYTDFLVALRGMANSAPDEILSNILKYPGVTTMNIVEGLVERTESNDEEYNKYLSELPSGEQPTEDSLEAYAKKPFDILYEVAKGKDLDQFAGYLETLLPDINRIMETEDPKDSKTKKAKKIDALRIDTVHGWKGLECKQLFVPMWQGNFPHSRIVEEDEMKQERRLAYVAMSRGEDSVRIIRPEFSGKVDRKSGAKIPTQTSQFVEEACVRDLDSIIADQANQENKQASFSWADAAERLVTAAQRGDIVLDFSEEEDLKNKWGKLMLSSEQG